MAKNRLLAQQSANKLPTLMHTDQRHSPRTQSQRCGIKSPCGWQAKERPPAEDRSALECSHRNTEA